MTKKMWAVVVCVVLVLVALAVPSSVMIAMRYDQIDTNNRLEEAAFGEMRGVSGGVETELAVGNARRVTSIVSSYGRERVYFPPKEPDETVGAAVYYGNNIRVHVVPNEDSNAEPDSALVYYSSAVKSRCYELNGYRAVKNVSEAVSPEGYGGTRNRVKK